MKAVVFDMDGVIFDTENVIMSIWEALAKKDGIEGIHEVLLSCIGRSYQDTKRIFHQHYGENFPYESFREREEVMFKERMLKQGIPLKEGVHELIDFLKEKGYLIGLASSTRRALIFRNLATVGLEATFDFVIGGDQVPQSKPHPDIYLKACEGLGVMPQACYAIEDSPNGIRSASRAGLKVFMVPDLIMPSKEIETLTYKICTSLNEVKNYLETMGEANENR